MRKNLSPLIFAIALLLCASFAHGQGVRWDLGAPGSAGVTSVGSGGVGGLSPLFVQPGATLAFCSYPANAVPCTNYVQTYTSLALSATCPTSTQVVLQGSNSCQSAGDNFGDMGVYLASGGTYAYTLTVNGVSSGPYTAIVPGGAVSVSSSAALQALLNATCNGTVPGIVQLAPSSSVVPVTASITAISNCTIKGPGKWLLTLQATSGLAANPLVISGVTNFRVEGLTIDDQRSANLPLGNIVITGSSSNITLHDVGSINGGNCVVIGGGSATLSNITVEDGYFNYCGVSITTGGGAFGIGDLEPSEGGSVLNHIYIRRNLISGNASGIGTLTETGTTITDLEIEDNQITSNSNDGIGIYSESANSGSIVSPMIQRNRVWCNGWPANGTGFPSVCTAGPFQTGATPSPTNGVGIDLTGYLLRPLIANNDVEYNYWDGIDNEPGNSEFTVVSTSGTAISWVSGNYFGYPYWKAGQAVDISNVLYKLASCSSQTSCTLQTSAGTHATANMTAAIYDSATETGNVSCYNGAGNPSGLNGSGFSDISFGSTYSGNIACYNNGQGFFDQVAVLATHNGDSASNNATGGDYNSGFICQGCSYENYIGVQANDSRAGGSQTQTIGVNILANSQNVYVDSPNLFRTETTGVSDSGYLTQVTWPTAGPATYSSNACNAGNPSGSGVAGTYESGTGGTCTVVISTGMTAKTGYACWAYDATTPTDLQNASTFTQTTFTVTGTTALNDFIVFGCQPF